MNGLKEILGEELFKQVAEKLGDKKVMIDDGNFIPKARFDQVNDQKKELTTQLEGLKDISTKYETLQSDVSKWKDEASQVPALQKKMEEWENTSTSLKEQLEKSNGLSKEFAEKEKQYQQQIKDTKVSSAIEKALYGVKNAELLTSQFDRSKIEFDDDGNIKTDSLNAQLEPIKEKYKSFWGKEQIVGTGTKVVGDKQQLSITKESIKNMSNQEINDNWEAVQEVLKQ